MYLYNTLFFILIFRHYFFVHFDFLSIALRRTWNVQNEWLENTKLIFRLNCQLSKNSSSYYIIYYAIHLISFDLYRMQDLLSKTYQLIEIRRPILNTSSINKCMLKPAIKISPKPTRIKQINVMLTTNRSCEFTPGSKIDLATASNIVNTFIAYSGYHGSQINSFFSLISFE